MFSPPLLEGAPFVASQATTPFACEGDGIWRCQTNRLLLHLRPLLHDRPATTGRGKGDDKGKGGKGKGFGGKGKGGGFTEGPPDSVVEIGTFFHSCEGDMVIKSTNDKVPTCAAQRPPFIAFTLPHTFKRAGTLRLLTDSLLQRAYLLGEQE